MNKETYLRDLNNYLISLPPHERAEIINDYQEHFTLGKQDGLTDLQIINKLGSPREIANQIISESEPLRYSVPQNKQKNESSPTSFNALAAIALFFFNLVFVLGPSVGLVGLYIGLYGAVIGLIAGGSGLILSIFGAYLPLPFLTSHAILKMRFFNPSLSLVAGIGLICLGALLGIGLFYLGRLLFGLIRRYINWNFAIIRGEH